ncbi:conserved hypothetical protein [Leishmania major strain Friedlin]|uniref:Kinetoplastid PH-like domain-containing protein n=1 Tax=Leishmania major TaxID=5664 RepID=E9AFI9_LEIMA|nr:conserved hypothetical protein [Leishmania major strain Friedlin]CAG9582720.1 hypothetical_protein_-_conserved [Leishmania major strain Friedlin]CBZ12993.1 conserved hypothetical protein [Leishmania major strain Friedlin]|eukprot:XP_003722759.1 conserved hypothetical protein [Leishmania major strain Friedlin]
MLVGLTGLMEWTVMQPSTASQLDASYTSSTGALQQARTYPALLTELTPTVLTGRSSASASAAPLVYATVSSLVEIEKIGPRQLRLRQELFGVPGTYRVLYLTAPSAVACDEWWRALYRLTDDQRLHLRSTNAPVAAAPSFHPDPESAHPCCDAAACLADSLVAPAPERSQEVSGVTELQRMLLFTPSSPCSVRAGRPSCRLRGCMSQSSPSAIEPSVTDLRTSQLLLRPQQLALGTSRADSTRHPVAVLPPSGLMLACDAATAAAAAVTGTSSLSLQCNSAPARTDVIPSIERPMPSGVSTASPPRPIAPVKDSGRRHLAQAQRPTSTSALSVSLPMKSPVSSTAAVNGSANLLGAPAAASRRIAAPPSLCALLGSGTDLCSRTASVSTASHASTASISGDAAEREAGVSPQTLAAASAASPKEKETPAAETVATLSSSALPREHVEFNSSAGVAWHPAFLTPATAAVVPTAAARTSSTQPLGQRPVSPRLCLRQVPLQNPPRGRSPSLTRRGATAPAALPSSEAAALAQASTAGCTLSPVSSAYEPIHVDSTTVSRAHGSGCSSPCSRLKSPSSALDIYLLHWYGCCTPSLTPRIMYRGVSPLWRRNMNAKGSRSRSRERRDSAATPMSGQPRGNRHCGLTRSVGRRRYSSSSLAHRSRYVGAAYAPAIPPLLSVIAQPHMFLKYPVRVSSPRSSDKDGAGADGAATYVFLTLDEDCVVTVPAARFDQRMKEASLLQQRKAPDDSARAERCCSGADSVSVGVRSFERAQRFFGADYCRAMPVAEVERVSRGNEEPLLLLNAAQRERFRDLSKMICIATQTHALILEATNSTDAERYVGKWKRYLRSLRGAH